MGYSEARKDTETRTDSGRSPRKDIVVSRVQLMTSSTQHGRNLEFLDELPIHIGHWAADTEAGTPWNRLMVLGVIAPASRRDAPQCQEVHAWTNFRWRLDLELRIQAARTKYPQVWVLVMNGPRLFQKARRQYVVVVDEDQELAARFRDAAEPRARQAE